jgi:membrane fusion protein (multidrug efflux system)
VSHPPITPPPDLRRKTVALALTACLAVLSWAGCAKKDAAATAAANTPEAKAAAEKATADKKAAADKKATTDKEKDKARQLASEAAPVETIAVARGPISAFLTFNSTLETEATVDIFPQTGGQVEELHAEEGKIVKAGDVLLKIEDRELRVDAQESTTNFEHLEHGFARLSDLNKQNLLNKQEFEDAKFQLDQARLRLERAKLKLSYATVRAPFDGVISSRDTQVGARVGSGTKVFSMVKLDEIVARVFVPGRYLSVVAENQTAIVTSEFLPDRIFKGWVKRISPVIDPKSGTFKVTIGVRSEKPGDLPPGLFVGVRVITDTRPDALLISKRAIVYEGGERYVFAVVNGKASKRKLVAGFEEPNNIEALSGFEVGTPVIVLGQSGLRDGSAVRVVNAPATPVAPATPPAADQKAAPKAGPAKVEAAKPGE